MNECEFWDAFGKPLIVNWLHWLECEDDSHWRSFRGENFQSCRGGINSTVASLYSFIKCLTILPIPLLINLLHLSSSPTHFRSWVNTHTLHLCRLHEAVCVCKYVYSALILCPWMVTHVSLWVLTWEGPRRKTQMLFSPKKHWCFVAMCKGFQLIPKLSSIY